MQLLGADQPAELTVFAAASLTEPLTIIGQDYERQGFAKVRYSFAASSTLARQIEAGAAPSLFLSANSQWMDYLKQRHFIKENSGTRILSNEIVVAAPISSTLSAFNLTSETPFTRLVNIDERIAMGDPDHVPAGIYSKRGLVKLGLWSQVVSRLARTDNTRAALILIERGEAPLGFIYKTDALISRRVKILATMPVAVSGTINIELAQLKNAHSRAEHFYNFLTSAESQSVFRAHGFTPLPPKP